MGKKDRVQLQKITPPQRSWLLPRLAGVEPEQILFLQAGSIV
jgi:hypothetical protein